MALKPKLVLKTTQTVHMTNALGTAIKMLELPNQELLSYLQEIALENPLLQVEEAEEKIPEPQTPATGDAPSFWDTHGPSLSRKHVDADSLDGMGPQLCHEKSLRQSLQEQLEILFSHPRDRAVAYMILDHMNASGYVSMDLTSLAKITSCPQELMERVHQKMLRHLEPTGILACSLEQCLEAQWQERYGNSDGLKAFFAHQDLYLKGHMAALCAKMGLSPQALQDFLVKMRSLNPKPGADLLQDVDLYPIPDLFFKQTASGAIEVALNDKTHPFVKLTKEAWGRLDSEAKAYIKEKKNQAQWMIKALGQRRENLQKLGSYLAEKQGEFFRDGPMALHPLTLSQTSVETGLHESTLSRLCNRKFAMTPHGLVPLKGFFTSSLKPLSQKDENVSSNKARITIERLIRKEDPMAPLSDDQLVFKLAQENIDISRRTIVKYRQQLGLASSYERKRQAKRDADPKKQSA